MKKLMCAAAVALAATATAAYPAETEYKGLWCGHAKINMLGSSPELTAYTSEVWAVEIPGASVPKSLESATVRCVAYTRVVQGKVTARSMCRFTETTGDTFTGEATVVPDQPNAWTFLAGTGKWKGVQGTGTWQYVSRSKPAADGTSELCLQHSGAYTLPQ
jgi:hypothetical protein